MNFTTVTVVTYFKHLPNQPGGVYHQAVSHRLKLAKGAQAPFVLAKSSSKVISQ